MTEIDIEQEVTAFDDEVAGIRARARACVEQFRAMDDENVQHLFAGRTRCRRPTHWHAPGWSRAWVR